MADSQNFECTDMDFNTKTDFLSFLASKFPSSLDSKNSENSKKEPHYQQFAGKKPVSNQTHPNYTPDGRKLRTNSGKPVSLFTLVCFFVDGKNFTYRGDRTLTTYKFNGRQLTDELQALLLKFQEIGHRCQKATLYRNDMPSGRNVLLQVANGEVIINNLGS